MSKLKIKPFAGREANVNAYILHNDTHAVVVDCLRNQEEAAELAEIIHGGGQQLQAIFITHGHPDHFIGLRTLTERFPGAAVLVARETIKADIIAFSSWMESVGWLDGQPQMKPRTAANPDGFDYEKRIAVLDQSSIELIGGGIIEIQADYPPMECGHMTTLFIPELNSLLTSDICYNGVHAWAGQGVEREHIGDWIYILGDLEARFANSGVKLYPGHGPSSDFSLFDEMRSYLINFLAAVDQEPSDASAMARMIRLYPLHQQADFLLQHSVAFHGPDRKRLRA